MRTSPQTRPVSRMSTFFGGDVATHGTSNDDGFSLEVFAIDFAGGPDDEETVEIDFSFKGAFNADATFA